MKTKRRPERFALRPVRAVVDGKPVGAFVAADSLTGGRLRAKGYTSGDVVFAEMKRPRNPGFHALAHAFGTLVVENIDAFEGFDPHKALKRLQMESGVGCEECVILVEGREFIQRWPISLAFESMEEGEFREVFGGLCKYVSRVYWSDCTPEAIEDMAAAMPRVA